MDQHEPELIERSQRGDAQATGLLLERYRGRLYNLCLRMVGHREDAAELTQEVMLKTIQHLGDFRKQSKFSTWMFRIAVNLSVSHLRKRRVRRSLSLDGLAGRAGPDDQSAPLRQMLVDQREPLPDVCVERKEQTVRLLAAIENLDLEFRTVLLLRDIEQMGYQELAQVLQIPVGTVKSRLFRARLALRRELTADPTPPTPRGAARGLTDD